jgi:hypothetical protein
VQREPAAEGLDPVGEPDEPRAGGGVGAAAAVVADLDPQLLVTGDHPHLH